MTMQQQHARVLMIDAAVRRQVRRMRPTYIQGEGGVLQEDHLQRTLVPGRLARAEGEGATLIVATEEMRIGHANGGRAILVRGGPSAQRMMGAKRRQGRDDSDHEQRQGYAQEADEPAVRARLASRQAVGAGMGGQGHGFVLVAPWSKMSTSSQPATSSRARWGRKSKQAWASAIRPSRPSIASSLVLSA